MKFLLFITLFLSGLIANASADCSVIFGFSSYVQQSVTVRARLTNYGYQYIPATITQWGKGSMRGPDIEITNIRTVRAGMAKVTVGDVRLNAFKFENCQLLGQ